MKVHLTFILIAFTLFACKNRTNEPTSGRPKFRTEALDTIKAIPAKPVAKPILFETAFIKGTKENLNDADLNLYGITIGKLKITSGKIIACDPLHIDEYGIPYTQVFPTGEFPVQLSIAELKGEETIAFVRINFSDEPVAKWEMALQKGQEPLPVDGEEIHGYGVDAGIGILMDEDASKVVDQNKLINMDADLYKEMDKHSHYSWKYAMYNIGKHNIAAFTSGIGDGRYASYIGFDASGKPCRLITDFGIFNWRKK